MNKIWWEKTDGPRRFLQEAVNVLAGGRSVVFRLPENLPWRSTMREVLSTLLENGLLGQREVRIVEAQEISKSPPEYVMKYFCDNKAGFRPYGDEAYAEFLAKAENISLNTRCIWIRNADAAQANKWFSFIAGYHKFLGEKTERGVFILETDTNFDERETEGVEFFSYDKKIAEYDCFAFNILIAAEFCRENDLMKQYLAEMITQLVEGDVELSAACVKRSKDFLRNPTETFEEVLDAGNFTSRKTYEDINFAIWLTQLKLIFPLVETFRHRLIKKYHGLISSVLPCNSGYGEKVETPEQVELGTLLHLVTTRRLWFDKFDWEELLNYRNARNRLAHLETLSFEEVRAIFEKNSRR